MFLFLFSVRVTSLVITKIKWVSTQRRLCWLLALQLLLELPSTCFTKRFVGDLLQAMQLHLHMYILVVCICYRFIITFVFPFQDVTSKHNSFLLVMPNLVLSLVVVLYLMAVVCLMVVRLKVVVCLMVVCVFQHEEDDELESYAADTATSRHTLIEMRIPRNAVGFVIGREGANVKEIQEITNTRINFKNPGAKIEFFTIVGSEMVETCISTQRWS